MKISFKNLVVPILALLVISFSPAVAGSFGLSQNHRGLSLAETENEETTQDQAQTQIATIFNNLETVGNSLNGGGTSAAGLAMLDSGCRAALEYAIKTNLFHDVKNTLTPDISIPSSIASNYISSKLNGMGQDSLNTLCAALKGEKIASPDVDQLLGKGLRNDIIPLLLGYGQTMANGSGIPFLSRLEIETGLSERSWVSSVTSVQPLWQDAQDMHHVFAQVSWYSAPDTVSDSGERTKYDTYNAGLAYRYLTQDKKYLYGANMFFDYAPERDHTRMSIGFDARTSQLAFSANRYMPLSTWRGVNTYNEERAAAGWDTELRGQIPELPSWTALVKAYQWDGFEEGRKLYGAQAAVEYSPVPALAVRVGARDESEGGASLEAAMRFQWRFDQPMDIQLKERTELAPVSDYVYEKVQRDNIIRVKQRRKHSTKLTVIETTGVNTALESSGSNSLFVGQTLLMPVTVTTANTVGAISRLRFNDGSILTSGQNTQVLIEPTLITLITGSIQYVNNGIIQTIVVPGGTVVLHGTDLDIVSNGTDSSVRVRDGSVTFTGSASGSADLQPEEMAESVVGVVGTIATGTADYITHTDDISVKIDRIADPQNGVKVAPYPYEAPRIVSENLTPGQQIVIGLKFNDTVTVSAGTPRLTLTINGFSRTASLISGSGTNDLMFGYTVQPTDGGATSLTVTSFDKNGASIMGNGKDAVTTIADKTLPLTGSVADVTAPSGYSVAFTTDPVNSANYTAAAFQFAGAEIGATYSYTISSSGGGTPVTGTGTIATATDLISSLNTTGLTDGTLTVSVTLTDTSSNAGTATTDTVIKDIVAPTVTSITFTNATYEP